MGLSFPLLFIYAFDSALFTWLLHVLSATLLPLFSWFTAQKMKFSSKDLFSKYHQIWTFLQIWPHLLDKFLMENLTFCTAIAKELEEV